MYMEAKASKKENEAKRGSKDVPVYVILTNTLHIHGIKERKTIERVQREPG